MTTYRTRRQEPFDGAQDKPFGIAQGRPAQRMIWGESIVAYCAPVGVAAVEAVESVHVISVNFAAEGEDVVSPGAEYDVMAVDGALNSSGLVGAFEMTREVMLVLIDLDVFLGRLAAVDIFGENRPAAADVVERSVFLGRRLRQRDAG
jgi:hypothetical protein